MQKKIVFLCSGKGSNFRAVVEHIRARKLDVEIAGLISDKADAGALELAKGFGIPTFTIPFEKYRQEKEKFHLEILPTPIINRFVNRMINIHPSLLPSFKGLKAIEQAVEYGVRYTGCTTHFVEEGMDSGAIILQSIVEILPNSTVSDLTASIHAEEHKILPLSVEYFVTDRIEVNGRKVIIRE
jgi:phosphoribosylglycinamide formyltransferase-1